MNASDQRTTRFGKFKGRSLGLFFLFGLMSLFFISRHLDSLSPLFVYYGQLIASNLDKLPFPGLADKLGLAINNIYLWSKITYESGVADSWWLISRWLVLAIIMGIIVPIPILILSLIIKTIKNHFKKSTISSKSIAEEVDSIKKKVDKTYRKSLLRHWKQAGLIVLALGAGLFCWQLLLVYLGWWSERIGFCVLGVFSLYAYFVYYDYLFGHTFKKVQLLHRIDTHLKLKQGLITLMEAKNFGISPRFYKLLLKEVSYKIGPADLSKVLPRGIPEFTKHNLAIPLLLIISLSGLFSASHSRLVSINFFSNLGQKITFLLSLGNEQKSIEKLLQQEADSLHLLTTELQYDQTNQPDIADIMEDLDELSSKLAYLAREQADPARGKPGINQNDQKPDTGHKGSQEKVNRGGGKSPNATNVAGKIPPDIPRDWPDDNITDIPLRPEDRYYQAVSAEIKKMARQLLALPGKPSKLGLITAKTPSKLGLVTTKTVMQTSPPAVLTDGSGARQAWFNQGEANDNLQQSNSESPKSGPALWQKIKDYLAYSHTISRAQAEKAGQPNKSEPKTLDTKKNTPHKKPPLKDIVNNLDKIGDKLLSNLPEAEDKKDNKPPGKSARTTRSTDKKSISNNIQLRPVKNKPALAEKQEKTLPREVLVLKNPKHLEIDPQKKTATRGKQKRLSPPNRPPGNLNQVVKVGARRIEELGNRLLRIDNPEHVSFNPKRGKLISAIWQKANVSVKNPRNIENRFSKVTKQIKSIDDPQQIKAITSELSELSREFSAWGKDSGNKLSRLRPDIEEISESDSLGRTADSPLTEGGPDKADRQAVIIRGRKQTSLNSEDIKRIRVEESPRHPPDHDITANVSAKLNQVANRLEKVDVASIKANMNGTNLSDFVVKKQRTLETLNNQLQKAKDFESIKQITSKISDLSAQLGKMSLDSVATAKLLAEERIIPEKQKFNQDSPHSDLMDKVKQDAEQLLKLSDKIEQEQSNSARQDTASQILTLTKKLSQTDFNQLILNDHNKLQLNNQFRNLSRQLQKISRHTNDLADLDTNSYAVASVAAKLSKLGVGNIGFSFLEATADKENPLDLKQIADQLTDLLAQMKTAQPQEQKPPTPYTLVNHRENSPQPERNQKLTESIIDGADRLAQIKKQLELTGMEPDKRKKLGLELLELARMFKDNAGEDSTDLLRDVSNKAIESLGNQIKELGKELKTNPADYQQVAERLKQIAAKLNKRNQELADNQLAGDQNINQLSADLLGLAQKLDKMNPADLLGQQDKLEQKLDNQASSELITQAARDLLEISQDLADMSADSPLSLMKAEGKDFQTTEQLALQLGKIHDELNESNLTQHSRELSQAKELGSKLKGISNQVKDIMPGQLEEFSSALARLGDELLTGNIPGDKASLAKAANDEARRKAQLAIKDIDRVLERLRLLYKKADRHDPELKQKRLKLGTSAGYKGSPYNKGNFTDKADKNINQTPTAKKPQNTYPMEHNLTKQDVFSRIIKRLEDKRERISRFENGALKQVKGDSSPRTGNLTQPQNIDHKSRMLTLADSGLKPGRKEKGKETSFMERPTTYENLDDKGSYAYKTTIPAKDIDKAELSNLPLEKTAPKLKLQSNLKLHGKQNLDYALQIQLIPLQYRKIIKELYQK